ncbi:hypothetical protein OGATHE_000253 [Ogataea polymorpha]|uniref:Secreted protein n=1 Tax=Ogataea polymorpha TaxID=460523 RepID=A0A9P8PUL7_9ASCO|nr:hypothetical protein OGATHE_000253 [Ogataea polymorpha]
MLWIGTMVFMSPASGFQSLRLMALKNCFCDGYIQFDCAPVLGMDETSRSSGRSTSTTIGFGESTSSDEQVLSCSTASGANVVFPAVSHVLRASWSTGHVSETWLVVCGCPGGFVL